jgi:hypothetical protein
VHDDNDDDQQEAVFSDDEPDVDTRSRQKLHPSIIAKEVCELYLFTIKYDDSFVEKTLMN